MVEAFTSFIEGPLEFIKGKRLLVAVSGGIDSVVLSHLLHEMELNFALAHCNFNLRGKESDADETFVIDLGEHLDAEVFIQHFDTKNYAEANKRSIQMAARELRYNWFAELADQLSYDYILTAHHADDNLETFLINFTRGTGLNGLTGIPMINDNIARPLLPFSREQIEEFAKSNNLSWREDSSNVGRKYLRNKLRHEVVPILKDINPELLKSFQNTLENLNDTADIVEESLNAVSKRAIVDIDENGIIYKVSEFKKVNNPKAYLFEMFKEYGFSEWYDVVNLLDAETGKYVVSQTHKLTKHREYLILSDLDDTKTLDRVLINQENIEKGYVNSVIGTLKFENVEQFKDPLKNEIYVDLENIVFPLLLRPWATGDVFYPLGMTGTKKVSKYLKDEKLTPSEKDKTWVLSSYDSIIWVLGRRADDRFKVTDSTIKILKITLL